MFLQMLWPPALSMRFDYYCNITINTSLVGKKSSFKAFNMLVYQDHSKCLTNSIAQFFYQFFVLLTDAVAQEFRNNSARMAPSSPTMPAGASTGEKGILVIGT